MTNEQFKELPTYALSMTQPWAWAVVHGGKPVENRKWKDTNKDLRFRGPFAVHAASSMTQLDYYNAHDFMEKLGVKCPRPDDLVRGGIIGVSSVVRIVTESQDPWFFGPKGLVLGDTKPREFIRCKGMLGFFKWKDNLNEWDVDLKMPPLPPLKWMKEWLR